MIVNTIVSLYVIRLCSSLITSYISMIAPFLSINGHFLVNNRSLLVSQSMKMVSMLPTLFLTIVFRLS